MANLGRSFFAYFSSTNAMTRFFMIPTPHSFSLRSSAFSAVTLFSNEPQRTRRERRGDTLTGFSRLLLSLFSPRSFAFSAVGFFSSFNRGGRGGNAEEITLTHFSDFSPPIAAAASGRPPVACRSPAPLEPPCRDTPSTGCIADTRSGPDRYGIPLLHFRRLPTRRAHSESPCR